MNIKLKTDFQKIHLWIPNIFEFKGGIQVYSDFLIKAIQDIYPNAKYDIFLKHDKTIRSNHNFVANTQLHFTGKIPLLIRTLFFATQIVANGIWQKPDLIITTHLNFSVAAYWLKKLFNIPYITVAHGVEAWNIKKPGLIKALGNSNKILAVSIYTKKRLIKEQDLSQKQVEILANTFDFDRFKITEKPIYLLKKKNINTNKKIILTVARLSRSDAYKGYDTIISALPQIIKSIPDIHYLIVGKGDDKPRIEQLIKRLKLEEYVTLTGFVPDEQLCDYYNLCDLFAMPSKGEGFGIVYLEALACGKPTLGGNQDGAIDALCNGELGALVDPDNMEEIANTLVQILQGTYYNSLLYQPKRLREKAIETFGVEKFTQTLQEHLQNFDHKS